MEVRRVLGAGAGDEEGVAAVKWLTRLPETNRLRALTSSHAHTSAGAARKQIRSQWGPVTLI